MRFSVEKSVFENELKIFQGIFEKKAIMDILQNIKISALKENTLEIVATDLEIGLTSFIKVNVVSPGIFTVNGKDFCELISKMPEGAIEISEDNDLQIVITNDKRTSKYKMLGMQASDYPELPQNDFKHALEIPIKNFQNMINHVYYVISPEMKFNLGGALLNISNKKIEIVATDGHRLSYDSYEVNYSLNNSIEYIISRKTLVEILRLGIEGQIDFAFDNNNLFFRYKNRILCSRIIDQKFPNYKAVIPEKMEFDAKINSNNLLQTLRRISILKTRNNGVLFNFVPGKLILERSTTEKGEGYDEINIDYQGKSIKVGFNGSFIIDFLTHINSDSIDIGMNNSETAFQFKPSGDDNKNVLYVVMPLNI